MKPQFRVLLVEDDYLTRQLLAAALQRGDLDVDVAESTWEAKRLIDRFGDQYCCILLDLALPDGSGTVVADHARATVPRVPILLVTGTKIDGAMIADYADVVRIVIRKPVDVPELSEMIISLGKATIPIRP